MPQREEETNRETLISHGIARQNLYDVSRIDGEFSR